MSKKAWDYYKEFLSWDIDRQNKELVSRPPEFWEEIGARKALEVFHEAAERVPAYKDFLGKNKINHAKIKTIEDFKRVPPIDKKNYLRQYPLKDLCWDGDLTRMNVISVSSGSTGEPFMWPRDIWQEREVDHLYELVFKYLFQADKKHSLVVIAFAMGMYIAGPFTFASLLRLAQKGYPITVTSPGLDITSVIRVIKNLKKEYEQVVVGGYPPFVKDVLEAGMKEGINWKGTKLFFGGESFSEKWRSYIHGVVGGEKKEITTVNMYGTADAGLLGVETPLAIALRQKASSKKITRNLFGRDIVPSVVTYNPLLKYFEIKENYLIFSSSSGIPLIRYQIGDIGGIYTFDQLTDLVAMRDAKNWRLPVLYLFGRDDLTIHFYALNIYPENIKEAIEDKRIRKYLTGKFIALTEYDHKMTQYLNIKFELAHNVKPLKKVNFEIKKVLVEVMRRKNSEYDTLCRMIKEKALPRLDLVENGHEDFKLNIKHKWVSLPKA